MLDLEPIKARCEQATKGPWFQGPHYRADVDSPFGCIRACCWSGPQAIADAEFIAHAREDVPALIAEVERLRAGSAPAAVRLLDREAGIDLEAYGREEKDAALKRKDREDYQFWAGWVAACERMNKAPVRAQGSDSESKKKCSACDGIGVVKISNGRGLWLCDACHGHGSAPAAVRAPLEGQETK